MKVAVLNDTHCGIRNSSEIFLENSRKFYSDVFFPYCQEHGIEQILHLGDYYDHRKFVNFKALNHNRKAFLDPLRKYGMKMDIIPGNHDTYYKNTNDLNSLKELLGHYMNEVHIVMDPTVMEYGSLKIALLPWINGENYESSMKFVNECKADWLGGHLELSGFDVMKGMKNARTVKILNHLVGLRWSYLVIIIQLLVKTISGTLAHRWSFSGQMRMILSIFMLSIQRHVR